MRLASDAVYAGGFALGVFLLHVDLQGLLVLVMPVAFRALEGLAGVSAVDAGQGAAWAGQPAAG